MRWWMLLKARSKLERLSWSVHVAVALPSVCLKLFRHLSQAHSCQSSQGEQCRVVRVCAPRFSIHALYGLQLQLLRYSEGSLYALLLLLLLWYLSCGRSQEGGSM